MCLPCYISPHHYARFIFLLAIRPSSSSSRRARRPRSSLSTDCLYRVLYQSTSLSISTCLYHIHLYQLSTSLSQLLSINFSLSQTSVSTSLNQLVSIAIICINFSHLLLSHSSVSINWDAGILPLFCVAGVALGDYP